MVLQQTTVLSNVRIQPTLDRGVFTRQRLATVETTPALLEEKGVKAHAVIPEVGFAVQRDGAVAP